MPGFAAKSFKLRAWATQMIGVVTGDDVLGLIRSGSRRGSTCHTSKPAHPISSVASRLVAANVYLGARPISDALQSGARIVVTGRVADASLTLGPAAAHFGWRWDEWDKLAGASVAGHLIECGAQATGALWHGWNELPDLAGIGYPIAELAADGSCTITKPDGTGGLVSAGTVTEQLLYEIDDPARYRTPDVDVDFTTVSITEQGRDRVAVERSDRASAVGSAQARGRLSRRLDGQRDAGGGRARRRGKGPPGRGDRARAGPPGGRCNWPIRWSSAWEPATSRQGSCRPASPAV